MTPDTCPVKTTLKLVSSKWKVTIIYLLHDKGSLRYGQIKRELDQISQKMLTESLRELEADGLLCRKDYHQMPLRVDYRLTDMGNDLYPLLKALAAWGEKYSHFKAAASPNSIIK